MLLYNNRRLSYNAFSFAILDGFYFDSETGGAADNYIKLVSPDEKFSVDLSIIEDSIGAREELFSVLDGMNPSIVHPISPLSVNGVNGYHTTYFTKRTQYYELFLDIDIDVTFNLVIETNGDILSLDCSKVISALDLRNE